MKILINLKASINCISTFLVIRLNYKFRKLLTLLLKIVNVNEKVFISVIIESYYLHTMLESEKLRNVHKYQTVEMNNYNIILNMS